MLRKNRLWSIVLAFVFLLSYVNFPLDLVKADSIDDGLIHYWKFDEGTGNDCADEMGNNNGQLKNGASWTDGKTGGAIKFDGDNDYVDCGGFNIHGEEMTIAFWMNPEEIKNSRLISKSKKSWFFLLSYDDYYWYIDMKQNKKLTFNINDEYSLTTPDLDIESNQWIHVAATYNGSKMKLYVNGIEVASRNASGNLYTNGRAAVHLGNDHRGDKRVFNGILDEVKIYQKSLSSEEVKSLTNNFNTGRIEAEDMYLTRYYEQDLEGASNSEVITMKKNGNNHGYALSTFDGESGIYDLNIGYFMGNQAGNGHGSETGGPDQYWLYINDEEIASWGNRGNQTSLEADVKSIENVMLETGDTIKIQGKRNGHDLAVLDYIDITPSNQSFEGISILEVQPGTDYELSENMFSFDVDLTQMSMPEFISKINDINGAYDVVYIGENGSYSAVGSQYDDDWRHDLPQGGTADSVEYYSGNDITDRRSQKLIEFIESGQLTIFDKDIFNSSLDNTKLYNNFIEYKDNTEYNNFNAIDDNVNSAITGYYTQSYNKRPLLEINDMPEEYNGNSDDYMTDKLLVYNFDIENRNSDNRMTAKLYIDFDGDGLFKVSDNELVKTVGNITSGEDKVLSYSLAEGYSGLAHWKIEIIDDETGAKAYEDGYTAFKGDEIKVNVLQLAPDGNTFDLSAMDDLLYKEGEFDIDITVMDVDDFEESFNTENPVQLNGNYDMIVLGFADMYGEEDISNPDALQSIKDFIASGQSVMFTHDDMTFYTNDTDGWTYNLTKEFRDLVGQNIYKFDPIKYPFDNEDEMHEAAQAARASGEYYEHRLDFPDEDNKTYGFSRITLDRAYTGDMPTTNKAHKLNEGLITVYPYPLDGEIRIANTHHQYYQLDLEDEEVIPWYTLSDGNLFGGDFNEFDGRNDYYTYSKGNITYSGTGHSSPANKEEENKMFVNTMLKATMGANHAPVLEVYGISEGTGILKYKSDISFSFKATDIDRKDTYLSADVFIDANNDGVFEEKVKHFSYEDREVQSGVLKEVTVDKTVSSDVDQFKLKVKAYDKSNAYDEYIVTFEHKDDSMMVLDNQISANGYLVGDTADVAVRVVPESADAKNKYENMQVVTSFNSEAFSVNANGWNQNGNVYSANIENIEFRQDGTSTWSDDNKEYEEEDLTLTFNKAGNYDITNTLRYTKYGWDEPTGQWVVSEEENGIEDTYNLSVKSGKIDIEVKDSDERGISGISISLVSDDETAYSGITNANGIYSFTDIASGTYQVSINVPDEYSYTWDGESEQVNLSYGNPQESVSFVLSGEAVNNIEFKDKISGNNIRIRETSSGFITEDLRRETYIDFSIYRPLESLNIEFSNNLTGSSISSAALYKGDTLIGDLTLGDTGYSIIQNLQTGSYRIKLMFETGDVLPEDGYLEITKLSFKEPQIALKSSINPADDSSLFIRSGLNIDIVQIESPVSNVWMTTKGGGDTLDIAADEPVMVKVGFDLSRSTDSMSLSFIEDTSNINGLAIDYIESIRYKSADGEWTYLGGDTLSLADLEEGSYEITLKLNPQGILVDSDDFNISLVNINTVEQDIGAIDLVLDDVDISVNVTSQEADIVDGLRVLAKVKNSEDNYSNIVNVQIVDNILQDSEISVKVKFELNEGVDTISLPLEFENIDSVEYLGDIVLYNGNDTVVGSCSRSNNTIKYNGLSSGEYYVIANVRISDDVSNTSRIDLKNVTITGDETVSYEYNNTAVRFNVEDVTSDVIVLNFADRFGHEQKVTVLKAGNRGRTYLRMDFKVTSDVDFLEYTLSCEEAGVSVLNVIDYNTPEAGSTENAISFGDLSADGEYFILFEIEMFGTQEQHLTDGETYTILIDPIRVRKNAGDETIQYSPDPPVTITAKVVNMPSLN